MGYEVPMVHKGMMLQNMLARAADWKRESYHAIPPQLFSSIKLKCVPRLHPNQPGIWRLKRKKRNQNRVNGSSRKKPKTDSCTDGGVGDGKPACSRSRKRVTSSERNERASAKKKGCKGIMDSENDAQHRRTPFNETYVKDSAHQGGPNSGKTGILDIYRLKTMPIDVSKYIVDISVNDLLSENLNLSKLGKLGNEGRHGAADSSLAKEVSKILQLMPKPDKKVKMENSPNLGLRSQLQESERSLQHLTQQPDTSAMDASEEPCTMKFTSSSDIAFPVAVFPLWPMEDFVSRLGLPTSEPLEKLFVKTNRQPVMDKNLLVNGNGSIPPLQHSTSPTGGSRSALKRDKESKNGSPWQRAGVVKCVNGTFGLGSGLGSHIKANANVECELMEREVLNKHTRREAADREVLIDLNVESSEQLLESSVIDLPTGSLLAEPRQEKLSHLSLHNRSSEGRKGDENTGECTEDVCNSRADDTVTENENLKRQSMCIMKECNSEKLPALHLEALKKQTANTPDVKNSICSTSEWGTVQADEKMRYPGRGVEFNDQKQEVRNLKDVQALFCFGQISLKKDERAQRSPSDLPLLRQYLDKGGPLTGRPNSPRVETAARILLDIANSCSQDNGSLLGIHRQAPCDILHQESFKSTITVHRAVNAKTISDCRFHAVEEGKDTEIRAPANEKQKIRMSSSISLVRKCPPQGADSDNQFQNKTCDSSKRKSNPKQGIKEVEKQNITEAEVDGPSSRATKPIRDDGGLDPVQCTSNQSRGNLQHKSLAPGKMHITIKSNQNTRENNGIHKFSVSGGQHHQKVVSVGRVNSSRPTVSFGRRKR